MRRIVIGFAAAQNASCFSASSFFQKRRQEFPQDFDVPFSIKILKFKVAMVLGLHRSGFTDWSAYGKYCPELRRCRRKRTYPSRRWREIQYYFNASVTYQPRHRVSFGHKPV